jgi:hypothetical protein
MGSRLPRITSPAPIKHLETVKRKTQQGHTFALRIALDLYDKSSSFLQAGMLHLIIVAWWRHPMCSPIPHYGIASLTHVFTSPLSPNGRQDSSIWSSQDAYLEIALLKLDDDHELMPSSHGLYEIFHFMQSQKKSNPTKQSNTHRPWVNLQRILDKAYYTTRSLDPTWYILYASCIDQLESNLHSFSWS